MSDKFEQWFKSEFPDADLTQHETLKGYNNLKYGWQAALSSLQGEAKPVAKIVYDRKTDENGNTYHKSRPQVWPLIADAELLAYPHGAKLFTHAPDAAAKIAEQDARIKELEQQLEVVRKDAERYQWLRSGGKDLGGEVIIYGYSPKGLDESIDAAIRQIGGAE